jgi:hypothetical protein
MLWLTEDALLVCKHQLGKVQNLPSQDLLTVGTRRVLIEPDPQGRAITGCPNIGPTIKPCLTTLKVEEGYSPWVRVLGHSVCLDTVTGLTDGTPPGMVKYLVHLPGQEWVQQR